MSEIIKRRGSYEIRCDTDVAMTARDGTVLMADVYRPTSGGPYPALVRRTPYGKQENDLAAEFNEAHFFASHGYVVVIQDVRGRYASEGVWSFDEGPDTYDVIEWAAALPDSSGQVGTFGQSYGALVQYLVAPLKPPHLTTCVPIAGPVPGFPGNGFVQLSWDLAYSIAMAEETSRREGGHAEYIAIRDQLLDDVDIRFNSPKLDLLKKLPLTVWSDQPGGVAQRLLGGIALANQPIEPFDPAAVFASFGVPMLHVGSWYDNNQDMTTRTYQGLRDHAGSELARRNQAILMGPWAHLLPYNQPTRFGAGEIDFGPEAETFLLAPVLEWFDHYLKNDGTELPCTPARIFVMGDDAWRDEAEWPPSRATEQTWYFHSGGSANTLDGDGTITPAPPGDEPADSYRYDPDNPVPTRGGHDITLGGVFDQRPTERRPDVLVYTSEPFERDVELVGPVRAVIYMSTSALDADLFAVLVDVRPDGYAHNLVESAVRLRHRATGTVEPAKPSEVYELTLNLWSACHVIRAGHRLRVHLTSSDFPRFDRNASTGAPIGSDTELFPADQTIHHNATHPSRVIVKAIER